MREFLAGLSDEDQAAIAGAMADVRREGRIAARHLRGDLYEVRATGRDNIYRVIFAAEGESEQVLLALESFVKKSELAPLKSIELARQHLADWRARGEEMRRAQDRHR